jgi:hypothetical protein
MDRIYFICNYQTLSDLIREKLIRALFEYLVLILSALYVPILTYIKKQLSIERESLCFLFKHRVGHAGVLAECRGRSVKDV